jgi:hypothetical protein
MIETDFAREWERKHGRKRGWQRGLMANDGA